MKEKSFNEINAIDNIPKNSKKILDFFTSEGLNKKDTELIDTFLNDKKFDLKQYNKLAIKVSKKREKSVYAETDFTDKLVTSLVMNYSEYNIAFYENLKKLLFDFYPENTTSIYINAMGREGEYTYIRKDTRQKALKKYNIPIKAYLIYLVSNYNSSYEAMLKGHCVTSYREYLVILKKEVKEHFLVLLEIMDIITIKAQIKLIDLLMEKEKEKTIDYILTNLINKATSKQLTQKIIEILENNLELKNEIIKLLKSKKKPAREIAVELLIKWKLPENKKLLTPLVNDKSKNIVSMIADFLATV